MNAHQKLRIIRQFANMTQTEFGETLGISKATVSNLEVEKVPIPPYIVILLKLLYNIDPEWLMDDSQEDLAKRFFNKTIEDTVVTQTAMYELNALDEPYRTIAIKIISTIYEMQKQEQKEQNIS